jgi:hypothetical protein
MSKKNKDLISNNNKKLEIKNPEGISRRKFFRILGAGAVVGLTTSGILDYNKPAENSAEALMDVDWEKRLPLEKIKIVTHWNSGHLHTAVRWAPTAEGGLVFSNPSVFNHGNWLGDMEGDESLYLDVPEAILHDEKLERPDKKTGSNGRWYGIKISDILDEQKERFPDLSDAKWEYIWISDRYVEPIISDDDTVAQEMLYDFRAGRL